VACRHAAQPRGPFRPAYAAYYRGLQAYFTDRAEPALALLRQADAMFGALDRARPNDPQILYAAMWNAYVAYGTASGITGATPRRGNFLDLAVQTSGRLLQIEANDHALQRSPAICVRPRPRSKSGAGHRDAAVAIQREVLRLYQAALGQSASRRESIGWLRRR
jgi:hypothetical protein